MFHKESAMNTAWKANVKRTYDEYQQESLQAIKENRTVIQKMLSDAQQYDNQRQATANLALSNAVDTANLVNKQAVAHRDLAIDREWNVDEVAQLIAKNPVFMDAMAAAAVKAAQNSGG